eukprot:1161350-Pelagomonas_calceolata.AAC.6
MTKKPKRMTSTVGRAWLAARSKIYCSKEDRCVRVTGVCMSGVRQARAYEQRMLVGTATAMRCGLRLFEARPAIWMLQFTAWMLQL